MTLQGGILLSIGNIAAPWLLLGFLAGRNCKRTALASAAAASAEAIAVIAFYALKLETTGVPFRLALLWLALAILSGFAMGIISIEKFNRWNLAIVGSICIIEPLFLKFAMNRSITPMSIYLMEVFIGLIFILTQFKSNKNKAEI